MADDWCTTDRPFDRIKTFLFLFTPGPFSSLYCEVMEGSGQSAKVLDKAAEKVGEPNEALNLFDRFGYWPGLGYRHTIWAILGLNSE